MALIKCPECGRDISDKAVACIGCGYVLKNSKKNENKKAKRIIVLIFVFVLLSFISVGSVMFYKYYKDKNAPQEKEETNSAVEEVVSAIDGLGEITIEDKENIEIINTLYNSLSEEDKALVTNHDVLVTANNKIAMLNLDSDKVDKDDKSQDEQNDQQDLDTVYSNINDELWDASDSIDDFLGALNNSSDHVSTYNSNQSKINSAKDSLNNAHDLCGDYKELQVLKRKIKTAIDSLPTGKVNDTDDFNSKLDDFTQFSYDLYDAQLEVAKYIDSK